jgi:pimeloyl-ACP methyl ester carboxylesterase
VIVLSLVALALAGAGVWGFRSMNSMPGAKATPEQIRLLARESVGEGDAKVSYLRAGEAHRPRVIYVHGTPGDALAFADFLVDPLPGLESISVDRLGFGSSGAQAGGEPSFEVQARSLVPLLVQRDGHWPILVGHSLGGPIVAKLAALEPGKVRAVVLVSASLDPAHENPGFWQRLVTVGLVRTRLAPALNHSLGELERARAETLKLADDLPNVRCPAFIIHGDSDGLVPYANVAYMQKALTGVEFLRVRTLERQGHFVPWERPDAIREAVRELARK